ncbi:MAG TPA: RNA polymerase sigma factor [Solirubrobacteraceae bacterium]|jgi:RNA polymerase sigma-70 factor (ECF subfamily)
MRTEDFEALYEAHAQPLFGFLAYRTGDRALAEDLLADTFEKALRGRRGFDRRKASEKTWLYSIALNTLRDHVRRQGAENRALERSGPAPDEDPADPFADLGHRDEVARALGVLSAEEREAVALRFGADLTVPEMAKLLGHELTTAEGRVYRALRKLRAEIARAAPR